MRNGGVQLATTERREEGQSRRKKRGKEEKVEICRDTKKSSKFKHFLMRMDIRIGLQTKH